MSSVGLSSTSIEVRVKSLQEKVVWFVLSDLHWGHANCDIESLKRFRTRALALAKDHVVVISFLGDLLDSVLTNDKRYRAKESVLSVSEAQLEFLKWLEPLAKHRNIRFNGMLLGNHEYTLEGLNLNPLEAIESQTKSWGKALEQYGNQTHNIIWLRCGNKKLDIRSVLAHRIAGGRNKRISFAEKMYVQVARDSKKKGSIKLARTRLFVSAHTHELDVERRKVNLAFPEEKLIFHDTQFVCQSGSFMKHDYDASSYAVAAGYWGLAVGYLEIHLKMEPASDEGDNIQVFERFNGDINSDTSLVKRLDRV